MATYFFCGRDYTNVALYLPDLARFLIDDLDGEIGPGYTVIDTYCAAAASPHEVPSDPTDMDSLAADNGWRTGNIAINDYIILEDSTGTHQVGIELHTATQVRIIGAPIGGFVVGNDDPDMTAAGNWGSVIIPVFLWYGSSNQNNRYTCVAYEDAFSLVRDPMTNNTNIYWTYVGELQDKHSTDGYGMVCWVDVTDVFAYSGHINGRKVSDVDGTTIVSCYQELPKNYAAAFSQSDNTIDSCNNKIYIAPTIMGSYTAGHLGVFGKMRGVYTTGPFCTTKRGKGTLGAAKEYAFWNNNSGAYGPIILEWDGESEV